MQTFDITGAVRAFEAIGVDLNPDAKACADLLAAAVAPIHASPVEPLVADLEAGKLTPANIAKRISATAELIASPEKIGMVVESIARPLGFRFAAALAADGDRLVADLRPIVAAGAADLTAAVEQFGPNPDQAAILAAGPAAAAAWQHRADTLATLQKVRAARAVLASAGYGTPVGGPEWWVSTADDLARARHTGTGGNLWWRLAAAGITPTANTADESAALLTAEAQADAERQAADAAARAANPRTRAQGDAWKGLAVPT